MYTHCLYCGKRLGFFHNKKKPYCSEVHEDRYLEQQAHSAFERLQDEYSETPVHTIEEILASKPDAAPLPLPLTAESPAEPEPVPPSAATGPEHESVTCVQPSPLRQPLALVSTRGPEPTGWLDQGPHPLPGAIFLERPVEPEVPPVAARPTLPGLILDLDPIHDLPAPSEASAPVPVPAARPILPAPIEETPSLAAPVFPLVELRRQAIRLQEAPSLRSFRSWEIPLELPDTVPPARVRRIRVFEKVEEHPSLPSPAPLGESLPEPPPIEYKLRRELRLPAFPPRAPHNLRLFGASLEWKPLPGENRAAEWKPLRLRPALILPDIR